MQFSFKFFLIIIINSIQGTLNGAILVEGTKGKSPIKMPWTGWTRQRKWRGTIARLKISSSVCYNAFTLLINLKSCNLK